MRHPPMRRPVLAAESLVALVVSYLVIFGNGAWWAAISDDRSLLDPRTWWLLGGCFLLLAGAQSALLAPLAGRRLARPLLALLVVVTGGAAYYVSTYQVFLDPPMLRNVVRTDWREASELLSARMVLWVALWCLPPLAVIVWVRLKDRTALRAVVSRTAFTVAAAAVAVAAALLVARDLVPLMREQRELRYLVTPGNLIYSLGRVAAAEARAASGPLRPLGEDARRLAAGAARPKVLVLVLGETVRSANFGVLGYARQTTPGLAGLRQAAVLDATACGTSTEVSVPCMFSRNGRADYDERAIRGSEGLLHVLRRAGVAVRWRDNQSGCKGVCDAPGVDVRKLDAGFAPDLCAGADCFDEILVRALKDDLRAIDGDTVIVLHMLGNHGPAYYRRYPEAFRRFQPDCRTVTLRDCSHAELVNAYDNAVLYTDHVLIEAVAALQAQADRLDVALLYVSDHGESLGEAGLYLHGVPYPIAPATQLQVPMVLWMSRAFADGSGLEHRCLAGLGSARASHDQLFDSVLGVLQVETAVYRPERDLVAVCRRARTAGNAPGYAGPGRAG